MLCYFGSNVLLSSFRQQVVVWGVVANGAALGGGNGDGSIVVDGCYENGGVPGERRVCAGRMNRLVEGFREGGLEHS